MTKVIAVGKVAGVITQYEVVKEDNKIKITSDGLELESTQRLFDYYMERDIAIGGTFWPEDNTLLKAQAVLMRHMFDSVPELSYEGDPETIPGEDGIVY